MIVVTSGVDSEYVLGTLAAHLRQQGHQVIELDFGDKQLRAETILQGLVGQHIVYITSAHTNLTRDMAQFIAPLFSAEYPHYLAPVELIPLLKPKLSIYIPHDLLTPYGDTNLNEYRFLDLYDYILAPFAAEALQAILGAQTRVIKAGWIKHAQVPPQDLALLLTLPAPCCALFVSMVQHLRWRFGVEGFVEYFLPLLGANTVIKLPAWHDMQALENAFASHGARVVPSQVNSCALIDAAALVLCNGASSIHAEAALLGKPVICLLDEEGVTSAYQREKLAHLPNVQFHDYGMRQPLPEAMLKQAFQLPTGKAAAQFNFALVDQLIREHLA